MYLRLTSPAIANILDFFPQELNELCTEQINYTFPNLFMEEYMGYILIDVI